MKHVLIFVLETTCKKAKLQSFLYHKIEIEEARQIFSQKNCPKLAVFNLFIYQAREVWPGPSRVSGSPVSAENVIDEAFVLMGELRWSFSSLL